MCAAGEQRQPARRGGAARRTKGHGELAAQLVVQQHGLLLHVLLLCIVVFVAVFPIVVIALLLAAARQGGRGMGQGLATVPGLNARMDRRLSKAAAAQSTPKATAIEAPTRQARWAHLLPPWGCREA